MVSRRHRQHDIDETLHRGPQDLVALGVNRAEQKVQLSGEGKAELSKAYQQIIFGRGPEAKPRKLPGNILVLQKDLPGVIESKSNCRLAVFKVIFEKFFLDSLVHQT